jgi:hypothetical protein
MTRDEKFKNLENWSKSLEVTIESMIPQVKNVLSGKTELPDGCPSKESAAALIFGQIEEKLQEVNAAAKMAQDSIWEQS